MTDQQELKVPATMEFGSSGKRSSSFLNDRVADAFNLDGVDNLEESLNKKNDPSLLKSKSRIAAEKETFDKAYGKLVTVTIVSSFFIVFQCIGGYLANSIAIFTDTAHLATDMIGFVISMAAMKISMRESSKSYTFGWQRAEIIGTLLSIIFMLTLTLWLLFEAMGRCLHPQKVEGEKMLIVAIMCFCFNLVQMKILHGGDTHYHLGGGVESGGHDHGHDHGHSHEGGNDEHDDDFQYHGGEHDHEHHEHDDGHNHHKEAAQNINVDAAFIHALGDMIMSLGVIVAAVIIYYQPTYTYADPACTFIFSICVCCTTGPIINKCLLVLMEGAPPNIDMDELVADIKDVTGCRSVHDFHIWSLSVGKYALSAHVDCDEPMRALKEITELCKGEKYGIDHITLQMENSQDVRYSFPCIQTTHKEFEV